MSIKYVFTALKDCCEQKNVLFPQSYLPNILGLNVSILIEYRFSQIIQKSSIGMWWDYMVSANQKVNDQL